MGMAKHRCLICKYKGNHRFENVQINLLYKSGGKQVEIFLCYPHTVEYFKSGQVPFFRNYESIFREHHGSEIDNKILEFIKEIDPDKKITFGKSNFY